MTVLLPNILALAVVFGIPLFIVLKNERSQSR